MIPQLLFSAKHRCTWQLLINSSVIRCFSFLFIVSFRNYFNYNFFNCYFIFVMKGLNYKFSLDLFSSPIKFRYVVSSLWIIITLRYIKHYCFVVFTYFVSFVSPIFIINANRDLFRFSLSLYLHTCLYFWSIVIVLTNLTFT